MDASVFDDSVNYTGPSLTDEMVAQAEARLGYALPHSYVALLRVRNGGRLRRRCFRTSFETSWAPDHFEIDGLRGIGGPWGIDGESPLSSSAMIDEWGYPRVGVVFCEMPSGGHDAVMLDYSRGGPEPVVVYVDEDRIPRVVAASFTAFLANLVDCEELLST